MFYLALIVVAITSRLLPHPPNVACLGAIGLFAGCYLSGRKAWLVPAAVLLCSDTIGHFSGAKGLGFYSPVTMVCVYVAATLAVPVGRLISQSRSRNNWKFGGSVVGGSLIASTLFFLVSNLGVWASGWYPATAEGLIACFVAAIPFYSYTLAGDLFFCGMMFGTYAAVTAGKTYSNPVRAGAI